MFTIRALIMKLVTTTRCQEDDDTRTKTLEALTSKQSHLLYSLPPKQNNVAIILSSVSVCFFCVAKQKYTHFGCRRQLTDDAF